MHTLLESAWQKLQQANHHLELPKTEIDAFSEAQLQHVGVYVERKTGEKTFRLDQALQEPPAKLHSIIGDALFNYRSALDHLARALVIQSGATPSNRTQFPIFQDSTAFNDRRRGRPMWHGVKPVIK